MTDYLFVEFATFIGMTLVFFILGVEEREDFPYNLIWLVLSTICGFETSLLALATAENFAIPVSMGFSFIGILSFIMVLFHVWDAYRIRKRTRENERWSVDMPEY